MHDKALKDSFPASDPPSTNIAERRPVRPVNRRPPIIDPGLVDELAKEAERKQQQAHQSAREPGSRGRIKK